MTDDNDFDDDDNGNPGYIKTAHISIHKVRNMSNSNQRKING